MSVLKSKRKASPFEVFHHWYETRKEITDNLLKDFGYSREKAERRIERGMANQPTDAQKEYYQKQKDRLDGFDNWFMKNQKDYIVSCMRSIGRHLIMANDIMPMYQSELEQRRLYQDRAIGLSEELKQELQYTIETLPVDINKYTRIADMLDTEIALIKGWRKSDNRFKKTVIQGCPYSASNFCNVNNNGNANNNSASNSNGVRPDFDGTKEKPT